MEKAIKILDLIEIQDKDNKQRKVRNPTDIDHAFAFEYFEGT